MSADPGAAAAVRFDVLLDDIVIENAGASDLPGLHGPAAHGLLERFDPDEIFESEDRRRQVRLPDRGGRSVGQKGEAKASDAAAVPTAGPSEPDTERESDRDGIDSGSIETLAPSNDGSANGNGKERQSNRASDSSSRPFTAARIIAEELADIPYYERQMAYEDLHGVRRNIDETEEMITSRLHQMDDEIGQIAVKRGYTLAREQNPDYVDGRDLRVMFLRSENYDPFGAARRLVAWCDAKLLCFGAHVLGRRLKLSDLCDESYYMLNLGKFQILPKPDSVGRLIMFFTIQTSQSFSPYAVSQVILYISETIFESAEAQKRGVVAVHKFDVMPQSESCAKEALYPYRCADLINFLPSNLQAFHYIFNAPYERIYDVVDRFQLSIPRDLRHRFRAYCGDGEVQTLTSYGILPDQLPFNSVPGQIRLDDHMRWMGTRKASEGLGLYGASAYLTNAVDKGLHLSTVDEIRGGSSNDADATATKEAMVATDRDVLMGLGRPYLHHPGNKFMRAMVAERLQEYDVASRTEKYDVARKVVRAIYRSGGRFLKRTAVDGPWFEVPWNAAREKVAHTFRKRRELDMAKARKGQPQQQQQQSASPKRSTGSLGLTVAGGRSKKR